jgi:hypothetical protein
MPIGIISMGMYFQLRQVSSDELSQYLKKPDAFYRNFERIGALRMQPPSDPHSAKIAAVMAEAGKASKKTLAAVKKEWRAAMAALNDLQVKGELMPAEFSERVARLGKDLGPRMQSAIDASMRVIDKAKQDPAVRAAIQAVQQPGRTAQIPASLAVVELQKCWHCLNFILTGDPGLAGLATENSPFLGGREIADRRNVMGYGPVRYFTVPEVGAMKEHLAAFPWSERIAAFDSVAARSLDIYAPDHGVDELKYFSQLLIGFFSDAADKKNGALSWMQ